MCKRGGTRGSGGRSWLNGWFNVFFPYIAVQGSNDLKPNPYCTPFQPGTGYAAEPLGENFYGHGGGQFGVAGPSTNDLPCGIASAPVMWAYVGRLIPMEFQAGFVGAIQRDDGTVCPDIGWAIFKA